MMVENNPVSGENTVPQTNTSEEHASKESTTHTHINKNSPSIKPRSQKEAIRRLQEAETIHLQLPFIGKVHLPRHEQLAYYGGLGLLAAFEIIDWPVALIIIAGHVMTNNHRSQMLAEFGHALEEA